MLYATLKIPPEGERFFGWLQRHPNPRIILANFVGEWVITTAFLGRDDDRNCPPRLWWVGACHPHRHYVACQFESKEAALRWHQSLIGLLSAAETDVTEF